MFLDHCYALGLLLHVYLLVKRRSFFEEGDPLWPIFTLPCIRWYGRNTLTHVQGHELFIPTKFGEHPLSSSVVKADYVPHWVL